MKKMMILVCVMMMATTANGKNEVNETASFDEVRVAVPARVRVVAGETYSVNVTAQNDLVASTVRCTVKGGVLSISSQYVDGLIANEEPLCITIVAPKDVKLTTSRNMEAKNVRNAFDREENNVAENK